MALERLEAEGEILAALERLEAQGAGTDVEPPSQALVPDTEPVPTAEPLES